MVLERMTGIEPALSAWKADVLPLDDIRVVWGMGAPTCSQKEGRLLVFLGTDTIITDLIFPTTAYSSSSLSEPSVIISTSQSSKTSTESSDSVSSLWKVGRSPFISSDLACASAFIAVAYL